MTPTSLTEPPRFDDLHGARYDELYREAHRMLWALNELDGPAITVPCGFTDSGLPVGLQLCAPSGRDADVLSAAERVENVLTEQHVPTH
ncbi:amidase family protein [Solicola gregarius]|uniref:Amidase family protein n=1 Tax=Solicola gregarius TaxID=2908642 RepID=A0AA46YKZ8_9ACTN|nr:amidase family protein [Solicola gregarius]